MIARLQDAFDRQNTFVSNASHELRTPIAVIQGYAGMLTRWGRNRKDILEESVDAIVSETEGMTRLVQSLLLLAKCDHDLQPKLQTFPLDELIAEVARESRLLAPDRLIDNHHNDPTLIQADRNMIKQMLRALIDNSINFTPSNGMINIDLTNDQDRAAIAIKDTGAGIPSNELDYIFDRFYCVDKARTKENGGCGLGLAIVKNIIDLHNGKISVESEPGRGTAFTVTLPLNSPDPPSL